MDTLDTSEERRRLTELYGQMTDGELLNIAGRISELTDIAGPILAQELKQRGLEMPRAETPPPVPKPDPDDPYAEDRELITLCWVWSMADAKQLEDLLSGSDIPFFMGAENATRPEAVTSNFADGVEVKIMRIALPWARNVLQHYEPANEPDSTETEKESEDVAIRCPKCGSEEVVFGDLTTEPEENRSKFDWTCDSCGHQWEDDGAVKET